MHLHREQYSAQIYISIHLMSLNLPGIFERGASSTVVWVVPDAGQALMCSLDCSGNAISSSFILAGSACLTVVYDSCAWLIDTSMMSRTAENTQE